MYAIQAGELTEEQWEMYSTLLKEINLKYYPDEKVMNWENNKKEILGHLELLKNDLVNYYLIFDDGNPVGWIARRILGSEANFMFDALYDEIPDDFLQTVFKELVKFLSQTNKDMIYTSAHDKRIINLMINSGAINTDTMVYSRLMRDELAVDKLNTVVNSVSDKINYKLVLYNEVTDEIIGRYLDLYNDSRIDMNFYNPERKIIFKRDKESLLTKLKYDKGPNDKMYMYMLFDGDNIAAFSSLYIREENKNIIDHGGGLTTVNRIYRGQNLAKFLKAKLYLKMMEEFPDFEYIKTDTYPWNKYMYRINEEMGFKPFKEYSELKISKEVLENITQNYD